jgi:hypothetical protein
VPQTRSRISSPFFWHLHKHHAFLFFLYRNSLHCSFSNRRLSFKSLSSYKELIRGHDTFVCYIHAVRHCPRCPNHNRRPRLSVVLRQSSPPFAGVKATAHVTHRRFTHPRFTLTSPILTGLLVLTLPPHLYSPLLPGICYSPVARLPRASTPSEKDSRELEQALGGP